MFKSHLKLCDELSSEKVSHAYIFSGESGVGKFTLAKSFARMILNEEKTMRIEAIDEYENPDLIILDGKLSKSQIDDMILESLSLPFEAKNKIYIINHFENMSIEGQNAILKTLEEPPEHLIIILVTSNISKLLPTIISRSRVLSINSVRASDLRSFVESKGFKSQAELISNISNGSIKEVTNYLENPELLNKRSEIINSTINVLRGGVSQGMKAYPFFEEEREEISFVFQVLELLMRDILIYSRTNEEKFILNIDYKYEIVSLNMDSKAALKALYTVLDARESLEQNVNFRIAIESMLIKLGELNDKGIRSSF